MCNIQPVDKRVDASTGVWKCVSDEFVDVHADGVWEVFIKFCPQMEDMYWQPEKSKESHNHRHQFYGFPSFAHLICLGSAGSTCTSLQQKIDTLKSMH